MEFFCSCALRCCHVCLPVAAKRVGEKWFRLNKKCEKFSGESKGNEFYEDCDRLRLRVTCVANLIDGCERKSMRIVGKLSFPAKVAPRKASKRVNSDFITQAVKLCGNFG